MYQSKLKRHLIRKHKDKEQVKAALALPLQDQKAAFENMRSTGILKTNMEEAGKKFPNYERARRTKSEELPVLCNNCKIFISANSMSKHAHICNTPKSFTHVGLLAKPSFETSDQFKQNILGTLRNDEVGIVAKTDPAILLVGYWAFQKLKKSDNITGSKETVRKEMRYLANLYIIFKKVSPAYQPDNNCKDLFYIKNFNELRKAIDIYTTDSNSNLKAGLKHGLQYALISAAKTLKAVAFTNGDDKQAACFEKFLAVLKLWENVMFGDSVLKLRRTSDLHARKPEQLPIETDLQLFRSHVLKIIKDLVDNIQSSENFIKLRNATCARLTLFNARRGGEPARLKIKDLREALNDKWIDQQRIESLDDLDKKLLSEMKIAYHPGKGGKLVPILFPVDTLNALDKLICQRQRRAAGIPTENVYVFASTKGSLRHISGWHCINSLTEELELQHKSKITATKNRHRVSTIYSLLDLTENERESFYDHMGHSKAMNQARYQCPPALKEVTKVGKFFSSVDQGK